MLIRFQPLLLGLLLVTLRVAPSTAQPTGGPFSGAPLVGPILAATPAASDRIVLYDLGSEATRDVSLGAYAHTVWGFSPDGCRMLVTLSQETERARMVTARLDGSDVREMVQYADLPPDAWGVWEPQWSPDGSRIAFTMLRETAFLDAPAPQANGDPHEYRIAWIPGDGGTPTFYSVAGDEHTPQWSPDSQWLAYIAYEDRVAGADMASTAEPTQAPPSGQAAPLPPTLREADLWVVRVDASEKFRLTFFDTGSVGTPRWSPDSAILGFVYSPVGNNDQFWMIGNRPGAIPTQLSYQWSLILDFTWLPNASAMLGAVRDFQGEAQNRLWRIPLVGNADTDAIPYVDDAALTYADYPRFSADGRWLALRSEYRLALVDTEAGTWRLLDDATLGNAPPVWSPPGFAGESACS